MDAVSRGAVHPVEIRRARVVLMRRSAASGAVSVGIDYGFLNTVRTTTGINGYPCRGRAGRRRGRRGVAGCVGPQGMGSRDAGRRPGGLRIDSATTVASLEHRWVAEVQRIGLVQLCEELGGLYGQVVDLLSQLVVLLLQPLVFLAQSLGVVVVGPLAPLASTRRRGAAWTGRVVVVVPGLC